MGMRFMTIVAWKADEYNMKYRSPSAETMIKESEEQKQDWTKSIKHRSREGTKIWADTVSSKMKTKLRLRKANQLDSRLR